jgi:hypothetical protein
MSRVCKEVISNFFNESFNKDQKKGKKRIFIFFSKMNNFEQKKREKIEGFGFEKRPSTGRLDTYHNDIQNNDTLHKGLKCDTQHKNTAFAQSHQVYLLLW